MVNIALPRGSEAEELPIAIDHAPSPLDNPAEFIRIGRSLIAAGEAEQAMVLAKRALVARPDDPLLGALARRIFYHKVPGYHYRMLRDAPRNAAYRHAIEALAPGRTVLDVGTGSGLLAMMAARAGALHVYACEQNAMLAATARETVAANGLADRITVIASHSGKLDRIRDLGGGVDLVVSEIIAHDVLGERVLPALAQVRAELCAPGALFLPERATVRVALAEHSAAEPPLEEVEGLDLSAFNRHIKKWQLDRPCDGGFVLRSAPADLMAFDFLAELTLTGRGQARLTSTGGRVTGIAQWLRIDLGAGATYENAPGASPEASWDPGVYPLRTAIETAAGEAVKVGGWHGANSIAIWAGA